LQDGIAVEFLQFAPDNLFGRNTASEQAEGLRSLHGGRQLGQARPVGLAAVEEIGYRMCFDGAAGAAAVSALA
jgi:hypothetical protein